jgi:ADP-dependent NAD(P)H-hydrate dehydratase
MKLQELTPALLGRHPLPAVDGRGDKNDHGRALVVAGSTQVPGAGLLAAEAALRTGAGKVALAVPRAAVLATGLAIPEARVMAADGNSRELLDARSAVLVGPGMAAAPAARWRRAALGAPHSAVILDAAGMQGLRRLKVHDRPVILTPHAGEMAKLLDLPATDITRDPVASAQSAVERLGAIVVLKGATTVIAAPGGAVFRHRAEIAGLGSSGSGDVLAGLVVGLLAQGLPGIDACLWGVALHAAAARRLARRFGTTGYLARELAAEVPGLMERARRRKA